MKFVKTLLAVAALGAAFSAQAESNINTAATGAVSAAAKLNFRVVIPRIIFLRVGTGTDFANVTTVDNVIFTATAANIGNATALTGATDGAGTATGGAGSVAVRVLSTGGSVNLSATSSVTGPTAAGVSIPWSAFSSTTSTTTLPAPAVGAAPTSITATNGVVSQTANWTFSYANTVAYQAGTYDGVVTYTAALP